jgi:hypothetical protein
MVMVLWGKPQAASPSIISSLFPQCFRAATDFLITLFFQEAQLSVL